MVLFLGGFFRMLFWVVVGAIVVGCKESKPDPVKVQSGLARIEIDGVLFSIPEKTWLKSYSLKKTDGLVGGV